MSPLDYGHVAAAHCGTPFLCDHFKQRLAVAFWGCWCLEGHSCGDSALCIPPLTLLVKTGVPPIHRGMSTKFQRVCFKQETVPFDVWFAPLLGAVFFNSLWQLQELTLQPGNAEKDKILVSFLKRNFKKLLKGEGKKKKPKTKGVGEIGTCVHAGAEVLGHRWGESP